MKNKFVDFKVLATSLCCSVVMGLISFAFLKCLDYAADFRSFFPLCYMFLPVAGIVTAFVYKRIGGKSSMGNNIIIESANDGEKVPKRLASLTFIFTCITHLFGGSVGREGTAVQIGGSLTSNVADYLGFKNNDRSTIVLSGISSAFGSVFGTPFAGAFFGMEVCCVGRLSAGAVIPCFACSYLANFVTQLLGFKHERYAISSIPDFDARFLFVFLIAAVCLGLIGKLFALGIKYVKLAYSKIFKNYLLAAAVGAAIVSLLIFALGLNNFEGLSTWMQNTAFKGDAKWYDMPAKYLLTVLTLGQDFREERLLLCLIWVRHSAVGSDASADLIPHFLRQSDLYVYLLPQSTHLLQQSFLASKFSVRLPPRILCLQSSSVLSHPAIQQFIRRKNSRLIKAFFIFKRSDAIGLNKV